MNLARPYAKFSAVKPGDVLITDGGFTCMPNNASKTVHSMKPDYPGDRGLYITCRDGKHMLDGQLDDKGLLIGLRRACT